MIRRAKLLIPSNVQSGIKRYAGCGTGSCGSCKSRKGCGCKTPTSLNVTCSVAWSSTQSGEPSKARHSIPRPGASSRPKVDIAAFAGLTSDTVQQDQPTPSAQPPAAKRRTGGLKSENEKGDRPYRFPVAWRDPEFYDEQKLEEEIRRVFEVCHGCRRCFSLCQSFPDLFSLIDNAPTGELSDVPSSEFKGVMDACTLCDMCFLSKCPYVPPHPLNIDFPHLVLRYRALENMNANKSKIEATSPQDNANRLPSAKQATGVLDENIKTKIEVTEGVDRKLKLEAPGFFDKVMSETDQNGKLASKIAPLVNTVFKNEPIREVMEKVAGIDDAAALPPYVSSSQTFMATSKQSVTQPSEVRRKVVLYATCVGNYNLPNIAHAASKVLTHNGVEVIPLYTQCCGMPQMEQGNLSAVAESAANTAKQMRKYIDEGYSVVSVIPSCTLLLKSEWPLLLPENEDVQALSKHTFDICEFLVDLSRKEGLTPGLRPSPNLSVTLHHACHSRAQNIGNKAAELLKQIPGAQISIVEKCSGHGGSWGCKKAHFEAALAVGKPAFTAAAKSLNKSQQGQKETVLASECPLAGMHIVQGLDKLEKDKPNVEESLHPVEIFAKAYGL